MTHNPLFKPVAATAFVLLLYLVYHLWLDMQGAAKLGQNAIPGAGARGNYQVVLKFEPESFHQTRLQSAGRLVKVEGRTVFLQDVSRDEAIALSRLYWVAQMRRGNLP